MSKRSNRSKGNTLTLDQRVERAVQIELARRFTNPQGGNVTPISQDILTQMQASLAPQDKTQGMFSPGAPIQPTPGITPAQGPRQWSYKVGYNIGQLPRSTEDTPFSTLRNLAALYDGIGLCLRAWFDLCSKPELQVKPRPKFLTDDKGDPVDPQEIQAKYGERIAKWEEFFAKPDKRRSLKKWMRMALKEVLEIDALSVYKHKSRDGSLYALEIIDGATIKPLLDERGMAPAPPFPAYQQFVYGVPGMLILEPDLIYERETERADSPYGFSRVERIILRVNQALRKQNKDLSTFTDGNMPAGTLEPPDDGTTDWTPEQLLLYQEMWDGMLSGNDAIKSRIKVIPPGAKFNKTDPDDIMTPFDMFLLNVTVADFGLTMSELGFTENVNKSSGDTQEAVIYRRAMSPIMDLFGEMFTDVMTMEGETDLYATWKAFEEPQDFKAKVDAWNILTTNGIQSTSQAAHALGLKPMVETEPFIIVPGQGIVFTGDAMDPTMRDQAKQAKLAGYQQQQQPPEGQGNGQGTQQSTQGKAGGQAGGSSADGGTGKNAGNSAGKSGKAGGTDATSRSAASDKPALPGQPSDALRAERGIDEQTTTAQATDTSTSTSGNTSRQESERRALAAKDYRRWRERSLEDARTGRSFRPFTSDYISVESRQNLVRGLRGCRTVEDVKRVFELERAKQDAQTIGAEPLLEYNPTLDIWEASDIEQQLEALRAQGQIIEWENHGSQSGTCDQCAPNDGVKRIIGEQFPTGHRLPQVHNNCQCTIKVVKE